MKTCARTFVAALFMASDKETGPRAHPPRAGEQNAMERNVIQPRNRTADEPGKPRAERERPDAKAGHNAGFRVQGTSQMGKSTVTGRALVASRAGGGERLLREDGVPLGVTKMF